MRRALAVAFLTIGWCAAPASAQVPPCDAAVTATATLTAVDRFAAFGDPTLVATHPAQLAVDFGKGGGPGLVDMESIRFSSATPGLREEDGKPVFVATDPGPAEIRVDWEQEFLVGNELRRCAGSAATTFTFVAPRPIRLSVSGGVADFGGYVRTRRGFTGQIVSLSIDVIAGRRSDFGDVTVRWRVRRGRAAYPAGPFQVAVVRPLGPSGGAPRLLGAAARLRLSGELFAFASRADDRNDIARIVLGNLPRFRGRGGYEVQVLQRDARLLRVRGTLRACHKRQGCRSDGRIESAQPLVTFGR